MRNCTVCRRGPIVADDDPIAGKMQRRRADLEASLHFARAFLITPPTRIEFSCGGRSNPVHLAGRSCTRFVPDRPIGGDRQSCSFYDRFAIRSDDGLGGFVRSTCCGSYPRAEVATRVV